MGGCYTVGWKYKCFEHVSDCGICQLLFQNDIHLKLLLWATFNIKWLLNGKNKCNHCCYQSKFIDITLHVQSIYLIIHKEGVTRRKLKTVYSAKEVIDEINFMKTRPLNHSQLFMILFNQGQMSLWYEKKLSLSTSKGKTVKMSYVVVSKTSNALHLLTLRVGSSLGEVKMKL